MMLLLSLVVFCGGWIFVSRHKHLLVMLLGLELMMLGLFGLLFMLVGVMGEDYLLLVFLTFAACEGSVGLGLLVGVVRRHGNDSFRNFSFLQC